MRRNYWSCSKFADLLRGTNKPFAATDKGWNFWKKAAQAKRFRFWLAEEGLDFLQDIVYWPLDCINSARHYFNNRWISKTHALTSNLKRGQWYDFDLRLLHVLFDELVNFVEVEQALCHYIACPGEKRKKYKTFKHLLWRCPEAGVAYLKWAAELKYDENLVKKEDPRFGQPTPHAVAAQETFLLYHWWKEKRPQRPDPSAASGWRDYCKERRRTAETQDEDLCCTIDESEEDRASKILDNCLKMEQEQEDEDTEMLIRLVKLRTYLWT